MLISIKNDSIESFDFYSERRGAIVIDRLVRQGSLDALYARREMIIDRLSKATCGIVIDSLSRDLKSIDKTILRKFGAA